MDIQVTTPDPNAPEPLYHQIYSDLSQRIRSGALPSGTIIPGEMILAKRLNVSRITIKRAMTDLAKAGLVRRRRGKGTMVIANTDLNFEQGLGNYIQNIVRLRQNSQTHLIERQVGPTGPAPCRNLKLPEDALTERICHSLSTSGRVMSYVEAHLPEGLLDGVTDSDLINAPIIEILRRHGVIITKVEQRLYAVGATTEIAHLFGIKPGHPLLRIDCIMSDHQGRAVQDIRAWYHTDHYQYQMTLSDIDQAQGPASTFHISPPSNSTEPTL